MTVTASRRRDPHMSDGGDFWSTGEISNQQLETSKGLVEYADVGQGRPILYFHGTGAGNDAAVIMERSLLDDGFRLIVPNRPGYYGTAGSPGWRFAYRGRAAARDCGHRRSGQESPA